MYLKHFADGARSAARARNRILRKGYVFGGRRVWSEEEDQVCRLFYPEQYTIARLLLCRSQAAIRARCRHLGLTPKIQQWTAGEISRLRRVYPGGTWEEIRAAVPNRSDTQIKGAVQYHKIRRNRKPYKPTGHNLIDQIRDRCFECNYNMRDIDIMAMSKRYFYKAQWHSRWINHKALARAVRALDGKLVAEWDVTLKELGIR